MTGLELVPDQVLIHDVAPLLTFEDLLSLRAVSKKILNAFDNSGLYRKAVQDRYSLVKNSQIAHNLSYFKILIKLQNDDREFKKLLTKRRVKEAIIMLAKKRGFLLYGLLRILEKVHNRSKGLGRDAEKCIRLILGLELAELEVKENRSTAKLTLSDMLIIDLVSDSSEKCFENALVWAVDRISDEVWFGPKYPSNQDDRNRCLLKNVLTMYMGALKEMKKLKNKWSKPDDAWHDFISSQTLHVDAVMCICRRSFVRGIKVVNPNCFEVVETSSNIVSYFEVDYVGGKFKQTAELEARVQEWKAEGSGHLLYDHKRRKELKIFETLIGDINSELQSFTQSSEIRDGDAKKESTMSSMIRTRSFFEMGGQGTLFIHKLKCTLLDEEGVLSAALSLAIILILLVGFPYLIADLVPHMSSFVMSF